MVWCCVIAPAHLLGVCVEGDRHVQQQLPVLHPAHKVLDADLQVTRCLVDLLRVALSCLGQLLRCLQQLVSISVGVLQGGGARKRKRKWTGERKGGEKGEKDKKVKGKEEEEKQGEEGEVEGKKGGDEGEDGEEEGK